MIRDLLIVKLIKTKSISTAELKEQVMDYTNCKFQELKPILETIAHKNKREDRFELKAFEEEIDDEI